MAIKCTNISLSKALQNLPKFGFFGFKIYPLATLRGSSNPTFLIEVLVSGRGNCDFFPFSSAIGGGYLPLIGK
jgi:hypothetical protein